MCNLFIMCNAGTCDMTVIPVRNVPGDLTSNP